MLVVASRVGAGPPDNGQILAREFESLTYTLPGKRRDTADRRIARQKSIVRYIKSLKQLVHFYNTRDVFPFNVTSGHCPAGKPEKVNCWPMPEVTNNEDMTVGNLQLTDQEENQIVAFLKTLTDGFTTPYPDIDTFTGQCMTGGNASTQGNETLISKPRRRAMWR
jgi:hypothetical protein